MCVLYLYPGNEIKVEGTQPIAYTSSSSSDDDLLRRGGRPFDLAVCNPPFLSAQACSGRVTEEPDMALVAGDTGFEAYASVCRSIKQCNPPLLGENGLLVFQLAGGANAAERAAAVCEREGARVCGVRVDERGINRCLLVRF